jgi:hypothetical protein
VRLCGFSYGAWPVCFPVNVTRETQPNLYQLSFLSLPIHTSANAAQAGGWVHLDGYHVNERGIIFWDITPSPPEVNQRFGGTCNFHIQGSSMKQEKVTSFMLVVCLAYILTMKLEATCSSETSDDFQRNTRRYIPENRTLNNRRCVNLKSYKHINGH